MARVRYVAVLADDPATLAVFYRSTFGLRALGASPAGDVSLTDGAINLTLFKVRPELGEARMERGLHHIGLEVDSIERAKGRFRRFNPRCLIVPEDADIHHGEVRFHDAESIPVSLSQRCFGVPCHASARRLVHIGFDVLDPAAESEFYVRVFGFTEQPTTASGERRDRIVSDGYLTLGFHDVYGPSGAHRPRYGISHLTFAGQGGPDADPEGNRIDARAAALA